ncbi:MAG: thioredoxin [candidate division WOR-3 bacterium]|nr:thioredoxin [candidate division WOR-3 bacterium]
MIEVKTAEEFKKEVLEADLPVVVDFWATWCQPCQILGPVMEELAADYDGRAKIVKVNVDEARELAQNHQVMSIPTVVFFKQGEIKDRSIGAVPKQILAEKLDALLEPKGG